MILSAIVVAHLGWLQKSKVVETKLFTVRKEKVVANSIALSPDLDHYAYATPDHKLVVDGKSYGPFVTNGPVVFSGDSKSFGFLASEKAKDPSSLRINGTEQKLEFQPMSLFRAGEDGAICWVERDIEKDKVRLVTPYETTGWFDKIEKVAFSDDGSNFYLRVAEKIVQDKDAPVDNSQPLTKDYIVYKGGKKVARERVAQIFPAPNGLGFAAATADDLFVYKSYSNKYKGELYGKPIFSDDGTQVAFRTRFTIPTPTSNKDAIQYCINGNFITDLQIQSGLTFSPDGKKWVMCGLNDKKPFLYFSDSGLVSFGEVAGLGAAPAEPYRFAKFVNGKMVFIFTPRRAKPLLFVEDKGIMEMGSFLVSPDSASISPDGRYLAIGGGDDRETHAYVFDLQNPGTGVDPLKGQYDLQMLGSGTFIWSNTNELKFMVLRKGDMTRVSAQI